MSDRHAGRVAFVTGAGSGIGRVTAERLASEGARIVAVDVRLGAAEETAARIASGRGDALALEADVRSREDIERARDAALERFGSLSYLVNNAGLVRMSTLDELEEDEWDLVLDTNLKSMYLVTRALAPALADGGGAVVNLSTVESEVVVSSQGHPQVHYNASKGGVKMLTKALAVELASRNVRVNAVAPGPIATSFVPGADLRSEEAWAFLGQRLLVPRVGEPEDVAAAISFLLSDDASFITGVQLPVDGGWLTR
jgi:glucose 1-dehydrogenase/3-oxoacyl-[acyl-carrier protein] reductase